MENKHLKKLQLAKQAGFKYDPETGVITTPTGKIVNKISVNGYLVLTVRDKDRKPFYITGHQYAWYWKHGEKAKCIDHINRNKLDNRISNLRSVSKSQNAMNMNIEKGYSFCKRSNRFIAAIMINYKKIHLGTFKTETDARNCYLENKEKYHLIKLEK